MREKLKNIPRLQIILMIGIFSLLIVASLGLYYYNYFNKRIWRADVLGVSVQSLTNSQAQLKLEQELKVPDAIQVTVKTPESENKFEVKTSSIGAKINYGKTVEQAYFHPRTGTIGQKVKKVLSATVTPYKVDPVIEYQPDALEEQLSLIAGQVYSPPQYPDIHYNQAGELVIEKGLYGQEISIPQLESLIKQRLSNLSASEIEITTQKVGQVLSDQDVAEINTISEKLSGKSLDLYYEDFEITLGQEELVSLYFGFDGTGEGPFENLISKLSELEREAKNPVFQEESGRVVEFTPATDGIAIKKDEFKARIDSWLNNLDEESPISLEIPTSITQPQIKNGDVNEYGIRELVGKGESFYRGSIPERVHNVGLAASQFNGVLIPPGEVFSFNKTVGDISTFTGYKQSYVIQGNQTVLGDGGGVCQVSTTLFRAVLDAGLEIIERRPHSYRVGYYEQGSPPGLDATIYTPTVDFKFRNNTDNYILIQTNADVATRKLTFELYGTDDGRVAEITKPIVSNVTPPPEDLYIDEPTLPAGEIEQIDYAAWGAKVSFDYTVRRDGKVMYSETFYSNYRPWQAKFLRGTGEAI